MAFQRVPNTAEIDVMYQQNVETVQNTFYARFGGAYSQANLDALAAAIDATVAAQWLPLQTLDCSFLNVEVKGLNAENDFVAATPLLSRPGLDVGEGLPNNVTVAVKKSSAFTGRSARGRTYWIGAPANKLDGIENFFGPLYMTSVGLAVDFVRAAINGAFNWQAVLVSRFTGGAKRPEGVTFDWLTSGAVNNAVDSQRGRLSGQ